MDLCKRALEVPNEGVSVVVADKFKHEIGFERQSLNTHETNQVTLAQKF